MVNRSVYEIRAQNLCFLIDKYGSQEVLHDLTDIAPSILSRLKNWKPQDGTTKNKRMGEKLARRIEAALELAAYWMDNPHNDQETFEGVAPLPTQPKGPDAIAREGQSKLSSLQAATRDTMLKLMLAGKLPDTACLKLLQSWETSLQELEADAPKSQTSTAQQ
jgi:hypothetical protein